MLSFGEDGIAVADEQSSNRIRKYNASQKLHVLNKNVLYGGSGPTSLIKEVYESSKYEINKIKEDKGNISVADIYKTVSGGVINCKNDLKNRLLNYNMGIGLDDYNTGILTRIGKPLDDFIKNKASKYCQQVDEDMSMAILLGGIDSGKFVIYELDSIWSGFKIAGASASIGSGSDESDRVLSSYVESLPRDKRESIDKSEGLIKILEATNASSRLNIGVGGTPSIVYMNRKGIRQPDENQCKLASEIVEGLTTNLLDKDFSYEALSRLVYDDEDFEKIEDEMMSKTKNLKKFNRILRGYKE